MKNIAPQSIKDEKSEKNEEADLELRKAKEEILIQEKLELKRIEENKEKLKRQEKAKEEFDKWNE